MSLSKANDIAAVIISLGALALLATAGVAAYNGVWQAAGFIGVCGALPLFAVVWFVRWGRAPRSLRPH